MEIILGFSGGPRVFPGLPLQCHIALSEWLHSSQLWSYPEDRHLRPEPPPLAPNCCRLSWECELLLSCEVTFSKISVANFLHFAYRAPVSLHSPLRLWRSLQNPVWGSFLICGNFSSFVTPFPGSPSQTPLCPFLSLSFALPHSKEIGLPFWKSGVLCQCSVDVLWELFHKQIVFWYICGGEGGLTTLFLCHLESSPS